MYSVRHFSCYFICIYFVVDDYIDLGQYKWILLQNTKEIGTFNRDVIMRISAMTTQAFRR